MNRLTRRRLEAAGWTVGDTSTFLGLSEAEARLVEIRVNLALALRETRRMNHWTQAELAAALGSSQSRVAKMEAGDKSVSIDLLVRSLLATGAPGTSVAAAFMASSPNRRKRAGN